MRILPLLVCSLLASVGPAAETVDPTDATRVLFVGNFMLGHPKGMFSVMLTAQPGAKPVADLYLAKDCHADLAHNHQPWLVAWITGEGTVEASSWRDNRGGMKPAAALAGKPFDLVVLQLGDRWLTNTRQESVPEETAAALKGFMAAIAEAKAKHVIYVHPSGLNCTARKGKEPVPLTAEEAEKTVAVVHPRMLALAKEHALVVAPTYLAFAELKKAHPDLDVHAPTRADDGHLSIGDSYLVACTLLCALSAEKPTAWGEVAKILEHDNEKIRRDNEKRKQKGEAELPPVSITPEAATAMQEAAWRAVVRFRADLAKR